MEIFNIIMSAILILNARGFVLNYDDEDRLFDMFLYEDYIPVEIDDEEGITANKEQQPVYSNGVWLCGNCSDISETNILYNESYDVESSYDEDMELQIGFAMDSMRCIKIVIDEDGEVARVSGACANEKVTLKVMNSNHCDLWIYS